MEFMHNFIFGVYPYIALAICLIGSWARFDLAQYTWKTGSSQMLQPKGMRLASNLFHIGIIFILCGHFVGLLMPEALYHSFISSADKQLVAMVSGGFFGILCLIGLVTSRDKLVGGLGILVCAACAAGGLVLTPVVTGVAERLGLVEPPPPPPEPDYGIDKLRGTPPPDAGK